jgi:predicted TIM-barrel fold metal-dependent hydrolase
MPEAPERLISADDHADLTHEAVKRFLDAKFHDAYDAGVAEFRAGMGATASVTSNNRWREQHPELDDGGPVGMGANRNHAAFGRPGHTDPIARLEDMDTDGVDASVTFCEVSAFRYLYLIKNGWAESTRAFNLALQEFASPAPHRLIMNPQIPIHDIDVAVAEVHWAASEGFKSLQLPVFPAELGLPDYWDSRYDPLWSAITAVDLPVTFHIGMNTALEAIALRDPTPQKGIFVPQVAMSTGEAYGHLVMTGLLARFPELRIVFVEPGIGWSAWWLNIADDFVLRQGYTFPGLTELPSHYFRQNIHLTFVDEPNVVRYGQECLGIENVMWSSDYPHPVSSWPKSRHVVEEMFAKDDPKDRELVVRGNAERVWKL